jgi:hypothetical protein
MSVREVMRVVAWAASATAALGLLRAQTAPRPALTIRVEPVAASFSVGDDPRIKVFARNGSTQSLDVPSLESMLEVSAPGAGPYWHGPAFLEVETPMFAGWTGGSVELPKEQAPVPSPLPEGVVSCAGDPSKRWGCRGRVTRRPSVRWETHLPTSRRM